jgi:hypothetical protein
MVVRAVVMGWRLLLLSAGLGVQVLGCPAGGGLVSVLLCLA